MLLTADLAKLIRLLISEVFLSQNNLNQIHKHATSSPSLDQISINITASGKAKIMSLLDGRELDAYKGLSVLSKVVRGVTKVSDISGEL